MNKFLSLPLKNLSLSKITFIFLKIFWISASSVIIWFCIYLCQILIIKFKINIILKILTINLIDNQIFFRDGIDEENLSGTTWKELKLKYRIFNNSHRLRTYSASGSFNLSKDSSPSPIVQNLPLFDQKCTEEKVYIENSIYDEETVYDCESFNDNINKETKNQSDEYEISLNRFKVPKSLTELSKQVEEANQELDQYIDVLIKKDKIEDLTKSRSESIISFETIDESCEETNSNFSIEEPLPSFQLVDVDYHSICINSFNLPNIPFRWYDSVIKPEHGILETNSKWRDHIFNELVKRNLREFGTIDKISTPYANDTSWLHTDSVQMLYQNKLVPCLLEIKHSDNTTRKFLLITLKQKSKIVWKKEVCFSNILLIKPYLITSKRLALSFAIYLNDTKFTTYIFVTSSKNQLNSWLSQVSIYCSKIHFFQTLSNALSLVTNDGYSFFSFLNKISKPIYLSQIDGHFKQIEKHSSGFTFGCGENGKIWFLDVQQNKPLDSYKGKVYKLIQRLNSQNFKFI